MNNQVKRKVVHVCLCGPYNEGWSYQDNLLPQYHKLSGNEVTVITSPFVNSPSNGKLEYDHANTYVDSHGIKIIRLKQIFSSESEKLFKLRKYQKLYETLDKERPDVLFIHGCQFLDLYQIKNYLKNHKAVSAYMDNHADFFNSARSWFSYHILHKIIWKRGVQKILPYIRTFYGVLPARVDFIKKMYNVPEEKTQLLVMAADDRLVEKYDTEENRKNVREKYHIKNCDFLIVTGGKIDYGKKQILLLIDAVKEASKTRKNLKLVIFGSIIEDMKNKVLSMLDTDCVTYIGWQDVEESYQLFQAADLACFPCGHSVFWEQAAGQGIPMLVKYWDGATHVDVGGNCKFLMEDTKEEIYEKLIEIADNQEIYDTMKRVAREKGKEVFSYRRIARESIEL